MEQRLIDLLHHARRWSDRGVDYLPTLGCSVCGKGCLPLCGLGMNRKISPMETKDIHVKSRKCMLETGKTVHPMNLQFVSGTEPVIMFEKAMDCVEEREVPGHGPQWVFVKPIPTMAGLVCRECEGCAICRSPTPDTVRYHGKRIKICQECTDACSVCGQAKTRHHGCCEGLGAKYFPAD